MTNSSNDFVVVNCGSDSGYADDGETDSAFRCCDVAEQEVVARPPQSESDLDRCDVVLASRAPAKSRRRL
jgi:hypothetical protein